MELECQKLHLQLETLGLNLDKVTTGYQVEQREREKTHIGRSVLAFKFRAHRKINIFTEKQNKQKMRIQNSYTSYRRSDHKFCVSPIRA